MNSTFIRTIIFSVIVLALALTACGGGGGESKSEPTAPPATEAPKPTEAPEPTKAPEATQEPEAPEATATTGEADPQPTEPPAEPTQEPEPESGIPYDVPVIEGAVDLDIQTQTGTVTYLLEETMIEDVVEFYKNAMTEQGWETVSASEIGLMATLVFQTENARLSVSLQANNIARTVNVRLFIIDK